MQMNAKTYTSLNNDQSSPDGAIVSHLNGEEENSVITWYQNDNDDSFSQLTTNNNEDFIEIDMFPEWPEQTESREDSIRNSPQEIIAEDINFSNFVQDSDIYDLPSTPPRQNQISGLNFPEILVHHLSIEEDCKNIDIRVKNEEKQKPFDTKLKYTLSLGKSTNISCYIDGLVSILQMFDRIDCYMDKFAQMTNDCRCTPSLRRGEVTLSEYLLDACGARCENCSMDVIVDKLNSIFLNNVARARFVSVEEIIAPRRSIFETVIGATNHPLPQCSRHTPDPGWLRRWLVRQLRQGVVAGIVYNDLNSNSYTCRPCNRVMFRLITGFTDEEFQLTIPVESVRDEIIENHLLREESIKVLKSNILKCRQHHDDFERILKQTDKRFNEMNVLGQIIGTFREKSGDGFRGFEPEEVHHIKIPNMHRNGVMLIVSE